MAVPQYLTVIRIYYYSIYKIKILVHVLVLQCIRDVQLLQAL
eukprot:SAG11_NODE_1580_length_4651_cov_5.701011_7_plen_42_part_00